MAKVRRINLSQVEGNNANETDTNEIRPYGEIGVFEGDYNPNIDNSRLELLMFDGKRTHLKSKVLGPGILYGSNADSGDGAGLDTIKLIPDAELHYNTGNDQYIIVDPTAPNHIHMRAGGTIDGSNADLFLGGEKNTVMVSDSSDRVTIKTDNNNGGTNSWQFESDGDLTVPNYIKFKDGSFIGDEGGASPPVFRIDAPLGLGINFTTDSDITGTNNVWSLGIDGSLTFPDATVQNTAFTGLAEGISKTTAASIVAGSQIVFEGYIDDGFGGSPGATLHVTNVISGTLVDGMTIYGGSLPPEGWTLTFGTVVAPQGSGGVGNYYLAGANFLTTSETYTNPGSSATWTFGTDGNLQLPPGGDIVDSTGTSVLGGGGGSGIALTDISVGPDAAASGSGAVSYDDTTGVFTYTPPALFDGQYASLTGAPTIPADTGDLTNNAGFITLSDVPAPFSGSYNDLTDKPTIPADVSDLTDTTGLLSGGGGGIALTDLSVGPDAAASGSGAISYDDTTGVFTYTPPETVVEIATDTNTVGAGVAGTIWTDADSTNTMAKLLVNGVEATTGDSQSLEVLITKKSDNTVAATVYAIVHTSASPLFTVAADWDSGTSRMILDATVPGANNIQFTVRSVTTEPGVGIAGGGAALGNSDFSDILVVSAQDAGYWTSYSLTGDYAVLLNYGGTGTLSLTNQTVYGHQFDGGDKVLFVNDAAINSNHYGLVIEFPSTPELGDVVSVAVMGDTEVVNAGSFVVGRQYMVKDVGDTIWSNIGGSGTPGNIFIATGVGSGTGTAYTALGVDRRIFKPASGQRIRIMAGGGTSISYYIGENETYKGAYVSTIGGQEGQTLLFTYVGVISGTPTWYQLYF